MPAFGDGPDEKQSQPLAQAHAHNDYLHPRPLLDALDHGFCSVEADVWLVGDELLVGHTVRELKPERTFESLYLEPLRERCRQRDGWVHDPGRSLTLLVDFKTDGAKTYDALRQRLADNRELFQRRGENADARPAVAVIISGDRPVDIVAADSERLASIDGRIPDLSGARPADLIPLVSDAWSSHFQWRGQGEMPAAERAKLRRFAELAHAQGRRLRFWGAPDSEAVWKELQAAGVDLIGADDLPKLQRFLTTDDHAANAAAVSPEHAAMLAELAESIEAAVGRLDTTHPVFHGCIDWHSAVHGHWALLRIANATGEHAELASKIAARLNADAIAAEAQHLREQPEFEMPYGRAWFLRLAIEYDLWHTAHAPAEPNALAAMADDVAASLAARYALPTSQEPAAPARALPPTPESREYANDAWALVQLHAFYAHRGDAERLRQVQQLVDDNFLNVDAAPDDLRFSLDSQRPDFFSGFGNWAYLLAHSQNAATLQQFWSETRPTDDDLRPVELFSGAAHHLGVNWSRAWALRAVSSALADPQEKARLDAAYEAHVRAGMAQHAKSTDDYGAYGHWVPQFAVYALTE